MATITPGDNIFDWKLVGIVFTTCRIGILWLILNLRAMGLTYCMFSHLYNSLLRMIVGGATIVIENGIVKKPFDNHKMNE